MQARTSAAAMSPPPPVLEERPVEARVQAHLSPPTMPERDWDAATAFGDALDRSLHAAQARFTGGLSPAAMMGAYWDWVLHLSSAPGKRLQLMEKAARKLARFSRHATECIMLGQSPDACIQPLPQDERFRHPAWQQFPYNLFYQSFLLQQQWWHNATSGGPSCSGCVTCIPCGYTERCS